MMCSTKELAAKLLTALHRAKEAVLKADELPIHEGLEFERKLYYYSLFATSDQKEGMKAILEKQGRNSGGSDLWNSTQAPS